MAGRHRIAIVGGGPAGLSAAAHAARYKIDHVLLERAPHLADTIFRYQRGKHVMDTPTRLQLRSGGDIFFKETNRETLLEAWNRQAQELGVNVRNDAELVKITGEAGAFTLHLKNGDTVEAEAVVLAIGTQGNPNLMRCDGAQLPHVQYELADPGAYIDEQILVVGGGDAGIENALGLAADPAQANRVTLVNRSTDFAKAKDANVKALMAARDDGSVTIVTSATPSKIERDWVTLETADGEMRLPCDRVIARMGTAPPRRFVESLGVEFSSAAADASPR